MSGGGRRAGGVPAVTIAFNDFWQRVTPAASE